MRTVLNNNSNKLNGDGDGTTITVQPKKLSRISEVCTTFSLRKTMWCQSKPLTPSLAFYTHLYRPVKMGAGSSGSLSYSGKHGGSKSLNNVQLPLPPPPGVRPHHQVRHEMAFPQVCVSCTSTV